MDFAKRPYSFHSINTGFPLYSPNTFRTGLLNTGAESCSSVEALHGRTFTIQPTMTTFCVMG